MSSRHFDLLSNESYYAEIPMNKILVVGGAGYVGSMLVTKLLHDGEDVRVLDKCIYKNHDSIPKSSNLEFIVGDTCDVSVLHRAIQGCTAVVYLAELVGDPACDTWPDLAFETNYLAPCAAALIARKLNIEKFIYTSSCSVYGFSSERMLKETATLNPVSDYGRYKVDVEKFLKSLTEGHFRPTILRLATVYGLSNRPRFDLMVNTITATACVDHKITIVAGESWRPFISVGDVADAIRRCIALPIAVVGDQTFNVGSGENYKVSDIGHMVKAAVPDAVFEERETSDDPRSYSVDFSKFIEVSEFTPQGSVALAIEELKSYLTDHPDWKAKEMSNVATVKALMSRS